MTSYTQPDFVQISGLLEGGGKKSNFAGFSGTKFAELSLFIIFEQNLVESMTLTFAYFKNLNISGTKRDI